MYATIPGEPPALEESDELEESDDEPPELVPPDEEEGMRKDCCWQCTEPYSVIVDEFYSPLSSPA